MACCGLGKKKPPGRVFDQTLVVLRHSERRDYVDQGWKDSDEGKAWPFDAPLTERGHQLAEDVAKELQELHAKAKFVALATSPYRRCLETAAAVAKLLKLPLIVDQELGEVWGREMPKEPSPFRTGKELRALVESLGIQDQNPTLSDSEGGGLKLFGKPPFVWPESLEDAKTRYLVRIQTYIKQSVNDQKNYILVTHADAVAAALQIMQWGNADVQGLDFCARLVAQRSVPLSENIDGDDDSAVYDQKFQLTTKAISAEIMVADKGMEKFYEKQHLENVEEKVEAAAKRKANRTKTDAVFSASLKSIAADIPESDSDQEEPNAKTKI